VRRVGAASVCVRKIELRDAVLEQTVECVDCTHGARRSFVETVGVVVLAEVVVPQAQLQTRSKSNLGNAMIGRIILQVFSESLC